MDRRAFLRGMCYGGLATFAAPMVSFATVPGRQRLVFVLLRGGFDGLAAVVPFGDPGYQAIRGPLALASEGLAPLSADFALAPGLAPLAPLWARGELAPVHAMAIPYRTRSHFDGQAVLETGLDRPVGASDGWLNRLLQVMEGERAGIAVAAGLPRSLSGPHPVLTWSPARLGITDDPYVDRLHVLYQRDPDLHDSFEAAIQMRDLTEESGTETPAARGRSAEAVLAAAARFLREPDGPNVAAVELGGWDTHANQGVAGGPLDRLLGRLAEGLVAFRGHMGDAWADTTVVVMTEFGRTARPNGTGGTDHGTAGAGLVLGPRLARSAVVADWPGLGRRDLYEGRDLRPTLDTRSVLMAAIAGVFDLTPAQVRRVFPDSESVRPLTDLIG